VKTFNTLIKTLYRNIPVALLTVLFLAGFAGNALALKRVNLLDADGNPVDVGFRWLVEEDRTYHVPLTGKGKVQRNPDNSPVVDPRWKQKQTLAVSFHQSYMPVINEGTDADLRRKLKRLKANRNYFITILPDSGYAISGAAFKGSQNQVDVYVSQNTAIPTAQISIFVHEDIAPINNVWDEGERGLEGFQIVVEDGGGKYGASAGVQGFNVYGDPLCTVYATDPDGNYIPDTDGTPTIAAGSPALCITGEDGRLTIGDLSPGKYGIIVIPPSTQVDPNDPNNTIATHWIQTSTIEGTRIIDAWPKANEPPWFGEFGPPGPHVTVGFAPASETSPYVDATALTGASTISGQVVNMHLSRPPDTSFHVGGPFPHTTPWVGLNKMAGGVLGRGIYASITSSDGNFQISSVPAGQYQLVIWDSNLDLVFAQTSVTVDGEGSIDLGSVPVFQWFHRMENFVFQDLNQNGIFDAGDAPLPEQAVNLRFRDGTLYQSAPTDSEGFVPFDETFPFFNWLVGEVDFTRLKATGVTVTVDNGGAIPFGHDWSFGDQLTPQVQGAPDDPDSVEVTADYRREEGPVLAQAFQGFLGQTNVLQWAKQEYLQGENGGISGVVYYAVTRAENDPEGAATEPWEPGIPRVKVELWDSATYQGFLDGSIRKAKAKPLMTTRTDSWDDSLPENCQYGSNAGSGTDDPFRFRGKKTDCYDGMRNWNQVRPGVFDGGYAFGPIFSRKDFGGRFPSWIQPTADNPRVGYMVPGDYVIRVIPPKGYKVIRAENKNVDFGDGFAQPAPQAPPQACVGPEYIVPDELSLFPGVETPLAGQTLNSCESKVVILSEGQNAAADFHLFTEVPIAGHIKGGILDDTANEFDPASPQFGEKYAPPFLPVSIRDWTGKEISRTVSDEYGHFNALVPSTFTQNLAKPSGISPSMLTACMNAKVKADGSFDPLHNPQYSQFCYTFQYMPGSTTYLDTPVVPVSAFTGPNQAPLDCEFPKETPRIKSVDVTTNLVGGGPYIPVNPDGTVAGQQEIIIKSINRLFVPNPAYLGVGSNTRPHKWRNFSFGDTRGTVTLGGVSLPIKKWERTGITVQLPDGFAMGGVGGRQLIVTRGDNGNSTKTGVTVQVGLREGSSVTQVVEGQSIQTAIDSAAPNDLILVGPGTYNEMVIMYKPVQLQGWGEGSTFINALKTPFDKLVAWRDKVEALMDAGSYSLIPGQELGFGGIEPTTLFSEEGAGVLVLALDPDTNGDGILDENDGNPNLFSNTENQGARIDGFNISGADTGGGIVVNGYTDHLEISNNKITNNSAFYAGGIRVGHPLVSTEDTEGNVTYTDAHNDSIYIHHNAVVENGGLDGAGGGIALHKGSDSYEVSHNFVCGNFTTADGAGIAHLGLSTVADGGTTSLIGYNEVLFNENFNQGVPANGGGIMVAGHAPTAAGVPSEGSGSVQIFGNRIQGNYAGSGDGGGILLSRVNGADVDETNTTGIYSVDVYNNMIVNNVAALAGAGISIQDALNVTVDFNTIAHNDNASTAANAFTAGMPSQSNPQPGAGVATHAHLNLASTVGSGYSVPLLSDNIIYQNRSFYWKIDDTVIPALTGLCPDIEGSLGLACDGGNDPVFDDLAVIGTGTDPVETLTCDNCLLTTDGTDPMFVNGGFNGNRESTAVMAEAGPGAILAPAALDEGGNFIRLRFGPLTQIYDFHIEDGSDAQDAGNATSYPDVDIDMEPRPAGAAPDLGADEIQ
jgi:hypothetical protein